MLHYNYGLGFLFICDAVRILSCHYVPRLLGQCSTPRYDDWDNWVLELESPLLVFSGA